MQKKHKNPKCSFEFKCECIKMFLYANTATLYINIAFLSPYVFMVTFSSDFWTVRSKFKYSNPSNIEGELIVEVFCRYNNYRVLRSIFWTWYTRDCAVMVSKYENNQIHHGNINNKKLTLETIGTFFHSITL